MAGDTVTLDPEVAGQCERPDYDDVLAALRRDDPVHRYRERSWLVTRYDDVRAISRDPERFRSGAGVLMDDPLRSGRPLPGSILHMDPPAHGPWRRLVARTFTPRAVARREARLRELARQVLEPLSPGDEIDYVAEVAAPFPVLVIADLLGVSDGDIADFRRWSDACIEGADGQGGKAGLAAVLELVDFLGHHVDERAARGSRGDGGDGGGDGAGDVLDQLAGAAVDGCPVTRDEAVQYALALLVAGNETTRHLLSGSALALSQHPDQRRALADDPSLVPGAVEELLRWVTPIQAFGRTATVDVELAGRPVAAGDWVVLHYGAANRDEAAFGPTAASLDVRRPVVPTHLAFGFGEHLCLGASLARLEARVLLEELVARFPAVEVVGDAQWVRSTLVRGMSRLPVRL